jgi:hypothetical protein
MRPQSSTRSKPGALAQHGLTWSISRLLVTRLYAYAVASSVFLKEMGHKCKKGTHSRHLCLHLSSE